MSKREPVSGDVTKLTSQDGTKYQVTVLRKEQRGKGRPFLILTEDGAEYIARLIGIGYTISEVAHDVGVSEMTLRNRQNRALLEYAVEKGHANYNTSIKKAMFRILNGGKGNVTMAIFLAKSALHMSDQVTPPASDAPIDADLAAEIRKYRDQDEGGQ